MERLLRRLWPGLRDGWNCAKPQPERFCCQHPTVLYLYLAVFSSEKIVCGWSPSSWFMQNYSPRLIFGPKQWICASWKDSIPGDKFYSQLFLQMFYLWLQIHRIQISLLIWNLTFPAWTGVTVGSDSQSIGNQSICSASKAKSVFYLLNV